jgi:hypothetical protein
MTILWYSIEASIQNGANNIIVNYYFSVNNTNNLITAFYNYNNIGVNVLAPTLLPSPFGYDPGAGDNYFDGLTLRFTDYGANFTDTYLQSILSNNSPYYNFYNDDTQNCLWSYTSGNNGTTDYSFTLTTNYINIAQIL